MNKLKVAIIQMHVESDKLKNIEIAEKFIKEAAKEEIDMAVLPEMFCCPYQTSNFPLYAEKEGELCHQLLSSLAKKYGIYFIAGSMPEKDNENRIYNTSYVFNPEGEQIGKHRKMHLFDISIEGRQHFKESETLTAGNEVTVFHTKFGTIGLCICYDLRFPELARLMTDKGAKVIIAPAAFNMTTGPAHWDILFRERAVDNQVYTIGVAPARDVDASYTSYGNSMIVSPWGDEIAHMDEKEGFIVAEIDIDYVDKIREELPLLIHRRKDIYNLKMVNKTSLGE